MAANNGNLTKAVYGNGTTYSYGYDKYDRVTSVSIDGTERYTTIYNNKGQVAETKDLALNRRTEYTYDISGRLLRTFQPGFSDISSSYDVMNRVTGTRYAFAGQNKTATFGYGKDGLKGTSTLISGARRSTVYDSLNRETSTTVGSLSRSVSYLNVSGSRTTTLPAGVNYAQGSTTLPNTAYTYDNNGNIASMSVGGVTYTYTYDSLNQLKTVSTSNNSYSAIFYYDNGGNITSKTVNGVTTAYGYGDTNWKDKLTSYDGQSITYDAIGNPLSYRDMTMSWTGRQLNRVTDSYGITHSYTYNSDGIRTKKVSTGFTTNYFLNGSTVLAEQQYDKTIWYIYGSSGEILGFVCNGTPYYYLKNQQGDVIKVVNASMNVVASYTYDAWGKVLSAAGSMANVNPIRYRGYYYDTETGFYYLQSRYYDPETGRFLNADGTIGANEEIVAYNLFAYCDNNPTNYLDDTGERKVVPVPRSYNYNYNRKLYFSGLIYDQCTGNAAKARFGAKTGDYNGCGWVATYNALLLSGRYIHPCNIISYYEQNGMVAGGLIGVMPWAIYSYLSTLGYSPQLLSNSRYFDQAMKTRNVAILLYIHAKGMHYIAVSKFGKYFWGYNVYIGDRKVQSLGTSLSGWLRSKKYTAIALITLRSNLVYRRV